MRHRHNSTISVKQRICVSCGKPCYWFSKKRCSDCARVEDTMKRMEEESERVIEEENLSGLIADADAVFSQYIRLKYANERGMVKCYTCGDLRHWTMQQNGHYVKRANLYTRWMEANCRPQCAKCNEGLYGNMAIFREKLDKEDSGITEIMVDSLKLVYKPTREEIRQVIAEYTPKVKALKKKLSTLQ